MAKTKKPTGLTITRDGSKYILAWKIADQDYGEGQTLEYRTKGKSKWRKWHSVSVGKTTTSKSITISTSGYYPNSKDRLTAVEFRIRGQRKPYQNKKHKTITPERSDWAEKTFTISKPHTPVVSAALGSVWNVCNFTFNIASDGKDHNVYSEYEWQTILVKESNVVDGSKLKWSTGNSGWIKGTGNAASGTKTITEDTAVLSRGSRTRWFRVRAKGPAGYTDWKYAKHVFAVPYKPIITRASAVEKSSNYIMDVKWTAAQNPAHPIDKTTVEYAFGVPQANMAPPLNPSWKEAMVSRDTTGIDEANFYTEDKPEPDECIFARVTTTHDTRDNYSDVKLVRKGRLSTPEDLEVSVTGTIATVTADNTSDACIYTGSDPNVKRLFLQIFYKGQKYYKSGISIGIIPTDTDTAQVVIPDQTNETGYVLGVRAVVGTYKSSLASDGTTRYSVSAVMVSDSIWSAGAVPVSPENLTGSYDGNINLTWDWNWPSAEGIEISWSSDPNAWNSTAGPESYDTDEPITQLTINNIDPGLTYYVRARFKQGPSYGPYSETLTVDATVPPQTPELKLSAGAITEKGKATASWNYISNDTTDQTYAEIECEDEIIGTTETSKYITLYAEEQGWIGGNEYELRLRVKSESGSFSEWSDPVTVAVELPATAEITTTTLENVTVTDDEEEIRTVLSLTEMPLGVTVTGAGEGGNTTLAIERATSYQMDRPDGDAFDGYEGETVFLQTQVGDAPFEIDVSDLIGSLDDGAAYRIVATVTDGIGQTATAELKFEVHWEHQALIPEGTVIFDGFIAKVTPVAPEGAIETDTCDIYRLSVDKPVLIYPNATFGVTVVDPYPTIGEYGGYRFVLKTKNGDYITEDNTLAWLDVEGGLEINQSIIDFGQARILASYNMALSSSWTKDFKKTKYLGGSVQGDWNAGTERESSINFVAYSEQDQALITSLRQLADYTGICHIRTVDGSSYAADVQVSEDAGYDTAGKIITYDLTIQKVDPEEYDGVLLSVWEQEEE